MEYTNYEGIKTGNLTPDEKKEMSLICNRCCAERRPPRKEEATRFLELFSEVDISGIQCKFTKEYIRSFEEVSSHVKKEGFFNRYKWIKHMENEILRHAGEGDKDGII